MTKQLLLDAPGDAEGRDPTLPPPMRPRHGRHPLPDVERIVRGITGADLASPSAALSNGWAGPVDFSEYGRISDTLAPPRVESLHPLVAQARTLTRFAAAVILVLVIAGAMVALLYPLRPWEVGERTLLTGSDTTAVERALAAETKLLDLTLTNMPTYRAQLGMFIATLLPGTRAELHTGAGPQLFYVAEGPVTVRVTTAPEPLEAIPPASDGDRPPTSLIAQGAQATMETGSTLLVPGGAEIDLFATGSSAGRLVDLLSATDSRRQGDRIPVQFASNGGMTVDLTAPVSITLRQGSLTPGATLPAPTSDATHQIVAPLGTAIMGDLRSGTGGSVRNAGQEPVDLYVLTVTIDDVPAALDVGS